MNETRPRGSVEPDAAGAYIPGKTPVRVLLVADDPHMMRSLGDALVGEEIDCTQAGTSGEAREQLAAESFDLTVLAYDLAGGDGGVTLAREIADSTPHVKTVLASTHPTMQQALNAFEAGAIDLITGPFDDITRREALVGRLHRALERSFTEQQRERRVQRLKRVCKKLNTARREVTQQLDSLCNDMVTAYQELAEQMNQVTLASEFQALLRPELEIESCLRTVLEFILDLGGSTNAAVFLPSNDLDFSLGAYVNYDLPRDTLDVLLDHLADVIPCRMQDETDVLEFQDNDALARWLGDDAAWIEDSHVITFSCTHDGECLAVVVLFRDQSYPFEHELLAKMNTIAPIFGKQLAQIIHVHHRASPDHEWYGFDYDDDIGGMAA
ncbi:MAG: response regulator [Phycisphaerales bacterium]|nr:response regulator [Phycisphaerales bacterium]